MKQIDMYTDGACSGNPGPGGWACILVYNEHSKQFAGGAKETTNNQMELTAVIEGLRQLKHPCRVHIYTDSKYVMDGAEKWLEGWKKNGWRKADKKAVLNSGLWQELDHEMQKHEICWTWVKGHAGHEQNELVDTLARQQSELYKGA